MRRVLIACALLSLVGCSKYIQERNVARLDSYAVRYPAEEARLANWLYPCFNGKAKSDTQISFLKPDTTWADTPISQIDSNKLIVGDVTDSGLRFDNLTIGGSGVLSGKSYMRITSTKILTVHDTVIDNRALAACTTAAKVKSDSLVTVKTQCASANKKANLYFWILAGIAAIVLVFLGIKTYIFFTGGAVANTAGAIIKKL